MTWRCIFEEETMQCIELHPVQVSENPKELMHKKSLIVDAGHLASQKLLLGSYNPTCNSKTSQEELVQIEDAGTIKQFAERFDSDWKQEVENKERLGNCEA